MPKIQNGLVMVVSNSTFYLNSLKFDDVFHVIMSKKDHRKISSGSTSNSVLNVESRGITTKRGNNYRNQEVNQRERGLDPKDQDIVGTMGN